MKITEKIESLIKELYKTNEYNLYAELEYYLFEFTMLYGEQKEQYDVKTSELNFEKAKYQVQNRDKYNSDRTASSHFKIDNVDKVHELEVLEASVKLLETKLKAYERYANYFKSNNIRDLALAKRID